jgi:hypothetical protein
MQVLNILDNRAWRRATALLALGLTAASLVFTAGLVNADPAGAYAYSCTGYGIGWKYGRPSQFCAQTDGSGLYVRTAGAGFSAPIAWAGWLVNTRVQLEFLDTGGRVYWSALSGQQNGGSAVGGWRWALYGWLRPGTARYTLLSNGATIATVQHTIR